MKEKGEMQHMEYITSETERAYRKRRYQDNKAQLKEKTKEYREKNRERVLAYQKKYTMTHDRSEYFKERHKKRMEETGKYSDKDQKKYTEEWNRHVSRIKASGADLSRIMIVTEEMRNGPSKMTVGG